MSRPIRVTVWGENLHERRNEAVRRIYPEGMHETIAAGIREHLGDEAVVRTATLHQPAHGLTEDVLESTDVLTWWGHLAHEQVADSVVARVHERVLAGMGLMVLHSAHFSKIFRKLMGTTCSLRWREADDREVVWTVNPGHPIAQGVPEVFIIPQQGMYAEYFDIPQPDELVFISQLKRSLDGTYHHVSEQHLPRYLAELDYRYSNREIKDGERTVKATRKGAGKRLMHRDTRS